MRQPDEPCVIGSKGDEISYGLGFTFIDLGGNRGFVIEERSDGSFKVTQVQGGDVQATAGAGASTSFTIADNDFGSGASASISGGVTFKSGQEWIVGSIDEAEELASADNWDRVEQAVAAGNPFLRGLSWGRKLLGIGPSFPAPDRVFVAGGLTANGSLYAGGGSATAQAEGSASRLLGFSREADDGEATYYFETEIDGSASAEAAAITDQVGAGLDGKATVLTSVTVDADGNIVKAARSALATGSSSGLTNVLFGCAVDPRMSENVGTGTQWDASLDVKTDADRDAVAALLASSNINPLGIGVSEDPDGFNLDPGGNAFMDAVRDRGDLTRYDVEVDDSTLLAGSGEVALGAKLGLNGSYSQSELTASNQQYWDGNDFADRTNC